MSKEDKEFTFHIKAECTFTCKAEDIWEYDYPENPTAQDAIDLLKSEQYSPVALARGWVVPLRSVLRVVCSEGKEASWEVDDSIL